MKHTFSDVKRVPDDAEFWDVVYRSEILRLRSWDENIKAVLLIGHTTYTQTLVNMRADRNGEKIL